ncbi:MAG TPA: hypothetical protein VNZ22_21630, partial [Bacillota bacterium]|nr:hypothetical protein [Bacillota bacterium]
MAAVAGGLVLGPGLWAQDAGHVTRAEVGTRGGTSSSAEQGPAEAPEPGTNVTSAINPGEPERGASPVPKHEVLFALGKDVELKAGDSAGTVVVIGGSAKIHGRVQEAAVAILGNLEVEGEVGDAAVAVLGNIKAGREARIKGAAVAVGGTVDALSGANIQGQIESLEFPQWLKQWFVECVLKLRPLAPQVGWVWAVAAVFLLIYLLIAT